MDLERVEKKNLRLASGACSFCFSVGETRCSVCWSWYCGPGCQAEDWPLHRKSCAPPPSLLGPATSLLETSLVSDIVVSDDILASIKEEHMPSDTIEVATEGASSVLSDTPSPNTSTSHQLQPVIKEKLGVKTVEELESQVKDFETSLEEKRKMLHHESEQKVLVIKQLEEAKNEQMRLETENTMLKVRVTEHTSRATTFEDTLKYVKLAIDTVLTSSPGLGAPKDALTTAIVEVEPGAKKALLQKQTNPQKDVPTKGATQALHHHQHILKSLDSLEQLLVEPVVTSRSSLTILPEAAQDSLHRETQLGKRRKSGAPENSEEYLSSPSKLLKLSDTDKCEQLDSSNAELINVPEEKKASEIAFLVGEQQAQFKILQDKQTSSMRVTSYKSSLAKEYSSSDQCASEEEHSTFKSRVDQAQAKESSKFRLRSPWGGSIRSDKDPPKFSEQGASVNNHRIKFNPDQHPTIQERKEGNTASQEEFSSAGERLGSEEGEGHIDTEGEESMDEVPGGEITLD